MKLRLDDKPADLDENELAFVLGISGQVASLAKKLRLDPATIAVTVDFSGTSHRMRFALEDEAKS